MADERGHETGITRVDIAQAFRALGIPPRAVILLHSSLRSFGAVAGGADTVVDGILDALGPAGTLVVPTLTGKETLSPEAPPRIDLRTAACSTGAFPEALRKRPDARRSTHPTHSCAALGAQARAMTRNHHLSPTPCGVTSPYFHVAQAGGYIVMAGCDLSVCTTLHTVEELANVPYHLQESVAQGVCIGLDGQEIAAPCRLHRYDGPERDFPGLEPLLSARGHMFKGRVGASTLRIVHAMGLIEMALDRLRFDPWYLTVWRKKGEG